MNFDAAKLHWTREPAAYSISADKIEIVTALTELGFVPLGFHRLEACVNLDNPASKAVLRKSGYAFACIREKYLLEDGVWTDNEIYCRINTQE